MPTAISRLAGLVMLMAASGALILLAAGRPPASAYPGANGDLLVESHFSGQTNVYRLPAAGGALTLMSNDISPTTNGVASADGSRIVAVKGDDIWTMNADGTSPAQLTNDPAADGFPTWSPDGGKIAFTSERDGDREIYVMAANGSNQAPLTDDPASDSVPDWSPDGTKIAFSASRGGNTGIYVIDANGDNETRVSAANVNDEWPSWSPDGRKLVFTSYRDGNGEIYTMNADGTNAQRLTSSDSLDQSPSWSPDGTMIAFTSDRDGDPEVFVMPATGGDATQLTFNTAYECCPEWAPMPPSDVVGDADCDDDADEADAFAGLTFLAGIGPVPECAASLNIFCTDGVTVRDLLLLFSHLAGIQTINLPAGCPTFSN